jgi:protein-L-isoaspartate O-methyltransferase
MKNAKKGSLEELFQEEFFYGYEKVERKRFVDAEKKGRAYIVVSLRADYGDNRKTTDFRQYATGGRYENDM